MPKNAAGRLVYCLSIPESAKKIKGLAVEETYTDHENNIQRVAESTGAKFSCVTVSQPQMNVPLQILHIHYRYTLMDHYDSMH